MLAIGKIGAFQNVGEKREAIALKAAGGAAEAFASLIFQLKVEVGGPGGVFGIERKIQSHSSGVNFHTVQNDPLSVNDKVLVESEHLALCGIVGVEGERKAELCDELRSVVVVGNYIGTDVSGSLDAGNWWGIRIDSSSNTIGSTTAGGGNVRSCCATG